MMDSRYYMSEKFFISPLFLKDIFTWFSILC